MHRFCLLILGLLLVSAPAFGQSTSNDSQTLQALLEEVRQLRHDLQTTTIAAQRAQILIHRVEAQESVVRLTQERVATARSGLAQIRFEQETRAATLKQLEEKQSNAETPPAEQKQLRDSVTQIKARLEANTSKEQEAQGTLLDNENQLRIEQANLSGLQDQLDRLERTLENPMAK